MTLVSVVIPVHNRGALVQATVDSVLAQDLPPEEFEIIVVNDGSTDDTFAVLQLYDDNPRVRLFHIENGGVARARNFGLAQARGEFIAFLDHDDLWMPDKLRLQLAKMRNPRVGVVYCDWLAVDEAGSPMPRVFQHSQQRWWRPQQGRTFPWVFMPHFLEMPRNPILSMSYPLVRAQLLRDVGGFDPDMVPSDDWDLWIRLARVTRFAFVPRVLAHYVHHSGQQHTDMERAYKSWLAICGKHPLSPGEHPFVWLKQRWFARYCRALLLYEEANSALLAGNMRAISRLYARAFVLRPDVALYRRWLRLLQRAWTANAEKL